jgi:hypothetical protein
MSRELSEADFISLYDPRRLQSGGAEFYRANLARQRGAGIGSFFKSVGRFLLPLVQKHVLPHAVSTVRNVMNDVIEGKNVGQAIKQHGLEGIKDVGKSIIGTQSGSGSRKRKRIKRTTGTSLGIAKKRNKRQKLKSIFD